MRTLCCSIVRKFTVTLFTSSELLTATAQVIHMERVGMDHMIVDMKRKEVLFIVDQSRHKDHMEVILIKPKFLKILSMNWSAKSLKL